ncbi:MAG: ABC transporter ATP-binding protein [Opitutales bacterium]
MTQADTDSEAGRPVLSARGLVRRFSSAAGPIEVLSGVDLDLRPSETVSIRGESGSGKSTLLNILAGLETWDAGTLAWKGRTLDPASIRRQPMAARRARFIGFVFQAYYLVPELNVLENVLLAARLAGRVDAPVRDRATHLLDRVGLRGREKQDPAQMSGGERQRVAVARALINHPTLLLADEPTGNLDERTGQAVMDLLWDLCAEEETGLLLVTHNQAFADRAERRLFLKTGRLEDTESTTPESS